MAAISRHGDQVIVTAADSPGEAPVEYSQFVHAIEELSKQLRAELLHAIPRFPENRRLSKLLPGELSA